jgi:NAD(P)-dependent dehydrogenase (short-subunit alcohol dehydrogenase family)
MVEKSIGRVAIVTGAGQGIGAAIAKGLAADGVTVVVNDIGASLTGERDDTHEETSTVQQIEAVGGTAVLDTTDVGDFTGVRQMVAQTVENFGRLDVVVNVAGILRDRMIFNMTEEEWDAVIRVHLKGHFNVISAAATHWRQVNDPSAHNRIISITSGAGLFGAPGQPNYAAAKMGIVGLTLSSANALKKYGVTANSVAPAANTRMTAAYPSWPKERWGSDEWSPDNIAPLTTWLASQRSAWCTGQVLGARGYEVVLYSNPAIAASLRAKNGWSADSLDAEINANFRALIDAAPANPLPTVSSAT